jgi:hypothetical protein
MDVQPVVTCRRVSVLRSTDLTTAYCKCIRWGDELDPGEQVVATTDHKRLIIRAESGGDGALPMSLNQPIPHDIVIVF